MNLRRVPVCVAVSGLFGIAACASRHARAAEQPLPDNVLVLEVENHNWSDVLIYVIHDGTRSRFMEVSAAKSTTEAIPARFVGSNGMLRLLVHRIGGPDDSVMLVRRGGTSDDYLTPTVSVRTGKTVSLTLESDLQRSSLGVW